MPVPDAPHLAAVAAVTFLAAFVQGVTGFGSALLAMPLLALVADIHAAAPLVALCSLAVNLSLLVPARHRLPWGPVRPLLAGSLAGIPAGVLFLAGADDRLARDALGAALVFSSFCLMRCGHLSFAAGKAPAVALGAVSGLLGGAFNATGPPVLLYAAAQPWDKSTTHAVLQLYFLVSGLCIAALHALSGLTTRPVLLDTAFAMPFIAAGSFAGYAVHRRIGEERFRGLLHLVLLAAGVTLIAVRGGRF